MTPRARGLPLIERPASSLWRNLAMPCTMYAETYEVPRTDLIRFAGIINWLVDQGVVQAQVGKPFAVKRSVQRGQFHRGALVWHVVSPVHQVQLNSWLGARLFKSPDESIISELPADWALPATPTVAT